MDATCCGRACTSACSSAAKHPGRGDRSYYSQAGRRDCGFQAWEDCDAFPKQPLPLLLSVACQATQLATSSLILACERSVSSRYTFVSLNAQCKCRRYCPVGRMLGPYHDTLVQYRMATEPWERRTFALAVRCHLALSYI